MTGPLNELRKRRPKPQDVVQASLACLLVTALGPQVSAQLGPQFLLTSQRSGWFHDRILDFSWPPSGLGVDQKIWQALVRGNQKAPGTFPRQETWGSSGPWLWGVPLPNWQAMENFCSSILTPQPKIVFGVAKKARTFKVRSTLACLVSYGAHA